MLVAGNHQAQAVVGVVAVDDDRQVHFIVLPGSVEKNRHLIGRARCLGEGGGKRGEEQDVLGAGQVEEGDEYGLHTAVVSWPPSAAERCKLTGVVRSFRTAMPPVRTG